MKKKKQEKEKTIPFNWHMQKLAYEAEKTMKTKLIIDIIMGITSIGMFLYLNKKNQD